MVETDLKLVDLALESLLDPQGLTLGLLFGLKRSRHGLHGASVVLPAKRTINSKSHLFVCSKKSKTGIKRMKIIVHAKLRYNNCTK